MKLQITKLRKQIYENLKSKAYALEKHSDEVEMYLEDQQQFAQRDFALVEMDHIRKQVQSADVIYLGDFHTFDQNIRNVLRIIKFITEDASNCIIGLEMIHSDYQVYIDAYMDKHLTDLEFLESIDYHDSWRFPWTHYKQIFDLARKHNLKVVGLNTEGTLQERDTFAANKLKEIHADNPSTKLLVVYGELHITRNKIPHIFNKLCPNLKSIILHQNLDEVYWELVKTGLEQGLVKFNDEEYCIVSAPPWIKYESMIYWYENLCDNPDFDIHEYIIENDKKIFSDDTKETFFHLCCEIVENLKLNVSESEIEDFNLYDHTNLEFVEKKLKQNLGPKLVKFYEYLIATNRSFRFPANNTYYCSSYSMNRISYLAGIHLFHSHLKQNQKEVFVSDNPNLKIASIILDSLFAYFFSKIINPHRKCDMYIDIQEKFKESSFLLEKKNLKLTLNILDNGIKNTDLTTEKLDNLYEAGIIIGHMLGEYLYHGYASQSIKQHLRDYFEDIEVSKDYIIILIEKLIPKKEFKNHQKRYF